MTWPRCQRAWQPVLQDQQHRGRRTSYQPPAVLARREHKRLARGDGYSATAVASNASPSFHPSEDEVDPGEAGPLLDLRSKGMKRRHGTNRM